MWQYNELYHHGIIGQKWGARRYQNPDGSLTEIGRARYSNGEGSRGTTTVRDAVDEMKRSNSELKLNNQYGKLKRKYKKVAVRQKIAGAFGVPGRVFMNITGRAVYDRVRLQMAEDKLDKTLDRIGNRYVVKYDSSIDAYRVYTPGQ